MLLAAAGEGTQVSCWHWSGVRKRSNLRTGLVLWCSSRVKWLHVVRYPPEWGGWGSSGQFLARLGEMWSHSQVSSLNTSSRGCIGSEALVKGEEKKKEATWLLKLHQNNCLSSFMC